MNRVLAAFNPESALRRRSLKFALLGIVVLFTLYPNPVLLVKHLRRSLSPNELIEPNNLRLAELDRELTRRTGRQGLGNIDLARESVLDAAQRLVYQRVPYQFDWHNWGCANYFPTVDEVMERGRADCKGRAVIAASLLARRGVQARLVSDLSHVWVWTPEGETMSPVRTASGRTVLSADAGGSRVDVLAVLGPSGLLADMPRRIGFAVAVFPAVRVAIMASAFWLVMLRREPAWEWALVGAWGLGAGVVCFKVACENIHHASLLGAWAGIGLCVLGLILTRRRASSSAQP